MTSREAFIEIMDLKLNDCPNFFGNDEKGKLALKYYESFKNLSTKQSKLITENGMKILKYAQENKDTYNNIFTARGMGDGIGIGSKVVSGAMRKLVTDGFFEKVGANPVSYSITEKGMNFSEFDN